MDIIIGFSVKARPSLLLWNLTTADCVWTIRRPMCMYLARAIAVFVRHAVVQVDDRAVAVLRLLGDLAHLLDH